MEFDWACGDRLVLAPSVRTSETDPNRFFHLSTLQPNYNYDNECLRRLIHESNSVFVKLRSRCSQSTLSPTDLQQISLHYQTIIRSIRVQLEAARSTSDECEENDNLLKMFKNIELVWNVIDVLFFGTSEDLPSLDLIKWSKWNFDDGERLESKISSDDPESFWNTIYLYLSMGRIKEAADVFRRHKRKNDAVFVEVGVFLKKAENLSIFGDKLSWTSWRNECQCRLDENRFAGYPELENIVKILSGDVGEIFDDVRRQFDVQWFQLLVGRLIFCRPFAKIYELADVASDCFKEYAKGESTEMDEIVLSIFELDLIRTLKLCSSFFDNWWFAAHLADLMHYGGSGELGSIKETIDLREYLLLEYANSLMTRDSFWQVAVDYFLACPTYGEQALKLTLARLPSTSDVKTLKMLDVCRKNDFIDVAKNISKTKCVEALKGKNLNKALSWCLQIRNPPLTSYLARQLLRHHGRDGLLHSLYLLDNLGESALICADLAFLGKYREFCKIRETGELRKAAALLTQLLTSRVAPREFWLIMLEDLVALMQNVEKDLLLFEASEVYCLMELVEEVENEIEVLKSKQFFADYEKDKEFFKRILPNLRLFLVKNIGKAIVRHAD